MTTLFQQEAKAINALKLEWEGVRAALLLDLHSHDWKVKFCPAEALEFCRHAQSYNNCYAERLVALVKELDRIIPKAQYSQPDNVNNGSPTHHFVIGNEGSRVIYVVVEHHALTRLSKDETRLLAGAIQEAGQRAEADENHINSIGRPGDFSPEGNTVVRLWWD